MTSEIEYLIERIHSRFIWDEEPVFCFTSDIDWASEHVLTEYFDTLNRLDLKPTLFVTHHSEEINRNYLGNRIERGLHPNFMNGSSHGSNFKEIAETCLAIAPEAIGFRSHRAFDLTDITHLMHNEYNFKFVSHQITIFQPLVKPILHESGLINFPVFFEDGTHLYNRLNLDFKKYESLFFTPGIKVISFHPMHFVFNSPALSFMRNIKDSLTRDELNNISPDYITKYRNKGFGIRDTVMNLIEFVKQNNFTIISMNELYKNLIY